MSTVIILTPVIIGSWPLITAAVAAAAAGLGMTVNEAVQEAMQENAVDNTNQAVEVELENSEVLASQVASGKELVVTKDGITIRVNRDAGQCKVCAEGAGFSKMELKQAAEKFSQKLIQCFVYHRTVSELKDKEFQVINEEVAADGSIRVHVRRWVD